MITRTIREQVTAKIRDQLVSGEFDGGQVLRETEMANRFGVSRGPIRDAFLQLSQEGFLAYQANCGVTVRHAPNPEHRSFIVSLRRQIEEFGIREGLKSISEESLGNIEAALASLRDACASNEVADVARADMAFHEAILVACSGDEFVGAWRQLCSRMQMAYTRLEDYGEVYAEHASIFEAVRQRDVGATLHAITQNLR
ncbi:MAG: GntR family transcriptional regulator [Planctomycetota bacterium]